MLFFRFLAILLHHFARIIRVRSARTILFIYLSYLGNERFVGVARILPQFPEPDLVIGNIAGSALTVPDYLTDPTILRPKVRLKEIYDRFDDILE